MGKRPRICAIGGAAFVLAWASETLGARSPFVIPSANAGFVPVLKDGSTLWAYLSGLRRTAFPMIAQNQPERTLFVASARDRNRCGITPVLKGLGYEEGTCFPGALNWMWSYSGIDRNDYLLKLHSTNIRASTNDVFDQPLHTQYMGSAAPWEVLLAQAEARLRWDPAKFGFVLPRDMWVDTPPNWNKASSPQVLKTGSLPLRRQLTDSAGAGGNEDVAPASAAAEDSLTASQRQQRQRALYDGWDATAHPLFEDYHKEFSLFGSQFELVDGLIHPSADTRMVSRRVEMS